eukprot:6184769-Pleurochrysis_carterae.AAC.4
MLHNDQEVDVLGISTFLAAKSLSHTKLAHLVLSHFQKGDICEDARGVCARQVLVLHGIHSTHRRQLSTDSSYSSGNLKA